jgi:protein involved in polysaccharide export with SLBB domain
MTKSALCIGLAFLMGCSNARPRYAWRDLTVPPSSQKSQSRQDTWGVRRESLNLVNPEIAPGFLLTMKSLADPKLNGDYRVDFRGNLLLPYDVMAETTGLTLLDLKKKLSELYRPYFKTPSEIDLQVKERRFWVDVRGLVEKPGRYLVEPEASLDAVIGLSGGVHKDPSPSFVRIQKDDKSIVVDLNQYYTRMEESPQILGWIGGEVLFFQKTGPGSSERASSPSYRPPIYMMGEVRKPGEYTLNPGSDFLDSLVLAGGFTEKADLDGIEIIRRVGGRKRVYAFSWSELQHAPTPVQGDVVFVHADTQTRSERRAYLWTALISAAASIATASVLVLAYDRDRL